MKILYVIIAAELLLFGIQIKAEGQTAVLSTGGDVYNSNGSLSYSLGQAAYTVLTGADGSVAAGVQQPYEIFTHAGLASNADFELLVYPNPTTDFLTLNILSKSVNGFSYHLYNSVGRLLEKNQIQGSTTKIEMQLYTPAVYFLQVFENEQGVKLFKIIKH